MGTTKNPLEAIYAKMSGKELRVQLRNDNAIARAGSLWNAYGKNPSRVVPGRGEWAGTFWCLKGEISDGPFHYLIDAVNHGRELDGLPLLRGFPRSGIPAPSPLKDKTHEQE